jgi:hypothetical protein
VTFPVGFMLLSATVGALVTLVLQGMVAWVGYLRDVRAGEFSGRWYAVLPASGGKPERRETMRIRQHGHVLSVSIRRYAPLLEQGRRWRMTAYLHGNVLIGVFYTTAPRNDPSSYGAIVLHRDYDTRDAIVWRGYYVRPDATGLHDILAGNAERHPILWQQVRPETRSFWPPRSTSDAATSPP